MYIYDRYALSCSQQIVCVNSNLIYSFYSIELNCILNYIIVYWIGILLNVWYRFFMDGLFIAKQNC